MTDPHWHLYASTGSVRYAHSVPVNSTIPPGVPRAGPGRSERLTARVNQTIGASQRTSLCRGSGESIHFFDGLNTPPEQRISARAEISPRPHLPARIILGEVDREPEWQGPRVAVTKAVNLTGLATLEALVPSADFTEASKPRLRPPCPSFFVARQFGA